MTQSLAEFAAGQLRAELARRQLPAAKLAAALGENESWVRKRARGRIQITIDDLDRITRALDLPPTFFVSEAA